MTRECQSPVGAPHWAIALIGLPWSVHGSGPDSFNCWEFVRMVQAREHLEELVRVLHVETHTVVPDAKARFAGHRFVAKG